MSETEFYIPEGFESLGSPTKERPELALSDSDKQLMERLFSNPLFFPKAFKTWVLDYVALNIPDLPISHIPGFQQFSAQQQQVITSESTTSTSYDDLATVGPQFTALASGEYVIIYGTRMVPDGTVVPRASVQVNADAVSDNDSVFGTGTTTMYGSKALVKTLSSSSNTLTMKYKVDTAGTGTFRDRWMVILRTANL